MQLALPTKSLRLCSNIQVYTDVTLERVGIVFFKYMIGSYFFLLQYTYRLGLFRDSNVPFLLPLLNIFVKTEHVVLYRHIQRTPVHRKVLFALDGEVIFIYLRATSVFLNIILICNVESLKIPKR